MFFFDKFCYVLVLITFMCITVNPRKHERKNGKLMLNPVELIHLIEQEKLGHKSSTKSQLLSSKAIDKHLLDTDEMEMTTNKNDQDKDTLRSRKIWSRWGKWSDCSVTCGGGIITRNRLCVSGRCAVGEREEQRRPCIRAPCVEIADPVHEEHDLD